MPKIKYVDKRFGESSLKVIAWANKIIAAYMAEGYELTLRQLYYQFVSKDLIPNNQKEYDRLGKIINDARLAGLVDWNAIVDRTRNLQSLSTWETPGDIIETAAKSYRRDLWASQPNRIEVWIEKDALVGVIERVCNELRVPYFSCRGYTSQSEMWAAAQRMAKYQDEGQEPVIIHLGDHDPSGIDMSRDIEERLALFMGGMDVKRIALNMNQVEKYNPPPNPAKLTDSRCGPYIAKFGHESWELDALEPKVIGALIRKTVLSFRDDARWDDAANEESLEKQKLEEIAEENK